MIPPDRIQAAARAMVMLGAKYRAAYRMRPTRLEEAEAALTAAFPELASGEAWIAPREATEEMIDACAAGPTFDAYRQEARPGEAKDAYNVMRDAYLKGNP